MTASDCARHAGLLRDATPHMDDFDALEALVACSRVQEALAACGKAENTAEAIGAAFSAFEAIVPDWSLDPDAQVRLWNQVAVRKELRDQLRLLEEIEAIPRFDEQAVAVLRRGLPRPAALDRAGEPQSPGRPPGMTNREAFDCHRAIVELDLKGNRLEPATFSKDPFMQGTVAFGEWMGRYSRRISVLTGTYGRLADEIGLQALVARLRARDAAAVELPPWDSFLEETLRMSLRHIRAQGQLDVSALEEPHGYGPSLRQLWAEARRTGGPDMDPWESAIAWARRRPAAWEAEDQRKKQGRAHGVPELGEHLARPVRWTATGEPEYPWAAEVDGPSWRIRINDFPDEPLYSLLIGDAEAGDFHDWPETWERATQ